MPVRVFVSQHVIRANKLNKTNDPPITVLRDDGTQKLAHSVELIGPARVVYSPDGPIKGSVRVWIEAEDAR